ncbi:Glyoxalase/bleomycin resistance protein/dioxygenase [Nitrospirillum viridazoti Y2]|uniref:Catechol 2,3-dioxygenase-like lactoylglutathione lyase family enzyme n=1 Tax=Nitrospirillum amazonense TaxID=28077 RepID=A0A560HYG9_9PROT|nr:VOC family protein [Nitrospirillum amazonense]EGY01519.1 Glyoxalase/bleomycin resistance protein/dioxygenase [Nitrospirillum amazonense Y2]TWB49960.1 catechol 2,3-dioxygenase-like lactoylglutathione lyase family enzyme [Nitrospirillum amazonense]
MTFAALGLTPLISVFDMPEALRFYREILGFDLVAASPEVQACEGTFSHWVWLRRGQAQIMLNTQFDSNERPAENDPARVAAHGDTVLYIGCADVDEAFDELTRRGLHADAPTMAPYGLRQFSTKDPDGYIIVFQEVR